MKLSIAAQWAALESHFIHHAKLVDRFSAAGPEAVTRMWQSQTNEQGRRLSQFERRALIERHCELFGSWPAHRRGYPSADKREKSVRASWRLDEPIVPQRPARHEA